MSIKHRPKLIAVVASITVILLTVTGLIIGNTGKVNFIDAIRPFLVLAAVSAAIQTAIFLCGKRLGVVGFAFPVLLFLFFQYDSFLSVGSFLFTDRSLIDIVSGILFVVICGVVLIFFHLRGAEKLALATCVVMSASAGASFLIMSMQFLSLDDTQTRYNDKTQHLVSELTAPLKIGQVPEDLPDIIYIVPDRYGDEQTLSEVFRVDTQEFRQALEDRGFFLAENARSNYAKTFQSLASTLNMKMLDPVTSRLAQGSEDRRPLHKMIRDNAVQKTLRSMGYEFVYLGNWWQASRMNSNASINYYGSQNSTSHFTEFERVLLGLTPLEWFGSRGECERLQAQLAYLKAVRERTDKPVFVFAHLTLPHPPITMDAHGKCIPQVLFGDSRKVRWRDHVKAFHDYVAFANRSFLEVFDANKTANTKRDMIFVIQADEGPYPEALHRSVSLDMHEMPVNDIRKKFGIINAIYWNSEKYGVPYLTETPVNNWRIILSKITGENIPLVLNERSLLMRSESKPYDMKDVTALIDADDAVSAVSVP